MTMGKKQIFNTKYWFFNNSVGVRKHSANICYKHELSRIIHKFLLMDIQN